MYKLRSWIDETKLTNNLSLNINAVEYLEEHPDKIDYHCISENINAIHIIEKNLDKCSKIQLYGNPNMVTLLRDKTYLNNHAICFYEHNIEFANELIKNNKLDKIYWSYLSQNRSAIHILEQHPEKIDWEFIIYNENAEHLIRNNLENVEQYWYHICSAPYLINLIEEYPEKIRWDYLSTNHNAIHLLKNNLEKINIGALCINKNGFELLLQLGHTFNDHLNYNKNIVYDYWNHCMSHNIEFVLTDALCEHGYTDEHFEFIKNHPIQYYYLSQNPNIFIYDYSRMKKTREQQPWYHNIKNEFI